MQASDTGRACFSVQCSSNAGAFAGEQREGGRQYETCRRDRQQRQSVCGRFRASSEGPTLNQAKGPEEPQPRSVPPVTPTADGTARRDETVAASAENGAPPTARRPRSLAKRRALVTMLSSRPVLDALIDSGRLAD